MMRLAAEAGNDKELLQLIKQNGLVTDPVNDDGSTLLHIAAIKGQLRKEMIPLHAKSTPLCVHFYLLWPGHAASLLSTRSVNGERFAGLNFHGFNSMKFFTPYV